VILLTGFEPFRQWRVNSSGEAARLIGAAPGRAVRVLPVDHEAAAGALNEALDETGADILLMTGLAAEARPRLELVARRPARLASGPETLAGLWPWARALEALRAAGVEARLSRNAGRYVCETAYWTALARRAEGRGPRLAAFLHVPPLSGAWPVERVAAAVSSGLAAAAGLDKPAASAYLASRPSGGRAP
jgi:pyroglutamyl-peptidase